MTLSKTSVQPLDLDDLERQLREVAVSSLPRKSDDPLAELARIVGRDGCAARRLRPRPRRSRRFIGRRREGPGRRSERQDPQADAGVRPRGLDQGGAPGQITAMRLAEEHADDGFRRRRARSSRRAGDARTRLTRLPKSGRRKNYEDESRLCRERGQVRRRRACSGHAGRGGARDLPRDDAVISPRALALAVPLILIGVGVGAAVVMRGGPAEPGSGRGPGDQGRRYAGQGAARQGRRRPADALRDGTRRRRPLGQAEPGRADGRRAARRRGRGREGCPAARLGGGPAPGVLRHRHSFRTGSGQCSGRGVSLAPSRLGLPGWRRLPRAPPRSPCRPLPPMCRFPNRRSPPPRPSVFGTPHRVSTVSVKPDGTIVSNGKPKAEAKVDPSDANDLKADIKADAASAGKAVRDHGVRRADASASAADGHAAPRPRPRSRPTRRTPSHPRSSPPTMSRPRKEPSPSSRQRSRQAQGRRSHAGRAGRGYGRALVDHAASTTRRTAVASAGPVETRRLRREREPARTRRLRAARSRSSSPRAPRKAMRARPWRGCKSNSRTSSGEARSIAPTSAARGSTIACGSAPCHVKPPTRSAPSSRPAARNAFGRAAEPSGWGSARPGPPG